MIRTVMVVEDDDAIRMVLRTNLEDEGYRVLEAVTAEQGLVIVQDEQPDVVLVDLRLPGIHGLDLVRSLRATSSVPIVIVTAQTDSHDVVAGLEAGADDYVTKPFVAKELGPDSHPIAPGDPGRRRYRVISLWSDRTSHGHR